MRCRCKFTQAARGLVEDAVRELENVSSLTLDAKDGPIQVLKCHRFRVHVDEEYERIERRRNVHSGMACSGIVTSLLMFGNSLPFVEGKRFVDIVLTTSSDICNTAG